MASNAVQAWPPLSSMGVHILCLVHVLVCAHHIEFKQELLRWTKSLAGCCVHLQASFGQNLLVWKRTWFLISSEKKDLWFSDHNGKKLWSPENSLTLPWAMAMLGVFHSRSFISHILMEYILCVECYSRMPCWTKRQQFHSLEVFTKPRDHKYVNEHQLVTRSRKITYQD